MADKRIDAHTNTTTVADVDEFIVDSGSNGTRNITYSNLKNQLLGTTSIATIGNSVTEAIYNTYTDIGDLTQTGVTGATVAAQISQLNDDIGSINTTLNTKLTLVESKVTSTGTTLTFDTPIQADTMYLIAMSAPITATAREMKCSMIRVIDTTNEISFGNSHFVVTVNNLKVTITNSSVKYGLRASLIKLE